MNNSVIFKTLFLSLVIFSAFFTTKAEPQLKFLSVVFRHGDRAPDNNGNEGYPNDPYRDFDFAPEGHGGLTNAGKRREYALGKELRELYGDFIGNRYSPLKVNARSTDYDRTKMSLQLVMSALFKPKKDQIWNPELNWQPIVANFVPGFLDVMMVPEECYQYLEEFERVKELPEVKARLNELSGFMKNLTEWTGKPITASVNMWDLYHTLMAEYSRNLTLPEWTNGIFPYGLLWNGTILEYETVSYNTKLKRLNGGMLLRNITESMLDVVNNRMKNGRLMNLFSGHETNVAALLNTLGVYTPHVPAYSSAILVELLGDSEGHYVRIRYYKGIPAETIVMKIPGCDELCPFEKFRELMKPVTPRDSELVCKKESVPSLIQKVYNKFSRID